MPPLRPWVFVAAAIVIAGCGSPMRFTDDGASNDTGSNPEPAIDAQGGEGGDDAAMDAATDVSPVDDTAVVDDGVVDTGSADGADAMPIATVYVYAHTSTDLYRVDPLTFDIVHVGAFNYPSDGNDHEMTDIAVTATGEIWGVTFDALYRVDSATANCTLVNPIGGGVLFNGLTFLPSSSGGPEQLVAATTTGEYYSINTSTGATTLIGNYGGGKGSSGDIVSVAGAGTYATVVGGAFMTEEYLARIDPATGAATIVGPTGVFGTWGLGYWGGVLYGFTMDGRAVTIDVSTGAATTVHSGGPAWWGAGVTTHAPITHG